MNLLSNPMLLSCIIFIISYVLIVAEVFDRTVTSVSGALLMIILEIISKKDVLKEVDFNTLGLLTGMMIIVGIMKKSGIFEYIAVKLIKVSKGEPMKILVALCIFTGIFSAFLDNVTTIVFVIPLTLNLTRDLRVTPVPFVIAEVFASNVGGTATLIGDPPNIMIGSAVGLSFTDFILNNGPIVMVILALTIVIFAALFKKRIKVSDEDKKRAMEIDEKVLIKDKKLAVKSIGVLIFTIAGFMFHGIFHLESSLVAIMGGVVLTLISGIKAEKVLKEVEWNTIFFFVGLFILVGGIKETGVIGLLAQKLISVTGNNVMLMTFAVLWISAIASAFIDNIPFVATMIPLIKDVGLLTGINLSPVWWALSLGACLGGNGTLVGASANVIASGMLEEKGHKLTFGRYFKIAFPITIFTVAAASLYLYVRYF